MHDLTRVGQPEHDAADAAIAQRLPPGLLKDERVLHVFNKVDAVSATTAAAASQRGLAVSASTGAGLDALRHGLLARAGWQASPEGTFIARTRHVQALQRTQSHLSDAAAQLASADPALDLLAEDLRLAQRALGQITGEFTADDLLGEIFSRFCIGK